MRIYSIVLGVIFTLNFLTGKAQNLPQGSLEIKPYVGLNIPVGDFSDFSQNGFNLGLSTDYYFSQKFGLGLDLSYQSLSFDAPQDYATILGENNISESGFGNFGTTNFGLGPTYRLGAKKFNAEIYSKAGLSFVSVPESNVQYTELGTPLDVFRTESQSITSFSLISGIRFNYALNDKISLFLNPQYLFAGKQFETFKREVDANTNPQFLEQDAGELCYTRPTTFGVNGGVIINLGEDDTEVLDPDEESVGFVVDDNNEEEENKTECSKLILLSPLKNQNVNLNFNKPTFKWKLDSKKRNYLFKLYEVPEKSKSTNDYKLIYEQKTKKSEIEIQESIFEKYKLEEEGKPQFFWTVEVLEIAKEVCNSIESSNFNANRSGVSLSSIEMVVECQNPAYDQNGLVCYTVTEYWSYVNTFSTAFNFNYHNVSTSPSGPVTVNYVSPSLPPASLPGSVTSPQQFTIKYEVCLPIGENPIVSELNYLNTDSFIPPLNTPLYGELPPCNCKYCDDWEFDISNLSTKPYVSSNTTEDYVVVEDNITTIPPSGNVVQMQAEIVVFEYFEEGDGSSTPILCQTCNKENSQHGVFLDLYQGGTTRLSNHLTGGFAGSGYANYRGFGGQGSRNILWKTPNIGGIPVTNIQSKLAIGVPKWAGECCQDVFKFCIRYTFTVYDPQTGSCKSCSEVVCYIVDRNNDTVTQL